MRGLAAFALGLATPAVAIAHPSHAPGSVGFAHYLSDPFHVGTLAVVAAASLLVAAAWRTRQRRLVRVDRAR